MRQCIKKYLEEHHSSYVGRYKYHSNYKTKKFEYRFLYYMLDEQFNTINVHITIDISQDELFYDFSIALNEQEIEYIVKDMLTRIDKLSSYTTILHSNTIANYINNGNIANNLEPLDYRNILDFLQYHHGITQSTIDEFFVVFNPFLERAIKNRNFNSLFNALHLILDKIVYEYEWSGETSIYYDTQYQYYTSYLCNILNILYHNIDDIKEGYLPQLGTIVFKILNLQNLAAILYDNLSKLLIEDKEIFDFMFDGVDATNNLIIQLFVADYHDDQVTYREIIKCHLRELIYNILKHANNTIEYTIANYIIYKFGHDLLIDLFSTDFNTFIFVCFPIKEFPEKYHNRIRIELEQAIMFYARRMEDNHYRLSSFEQVNNIYRILMDNYKESYE